MPTTGTSTANTAPPLNTGKRSEETASWLKFTQSEWPGPDLTKISSISSALTLIYQASYQQGQIPDDGNALS